MLNCQLLVVPVWLCISSYKSSCLLIQWREQKVNCKIPESPEAIRRWRFATNEGGQWVCVLCLRVCACVLNWAEVKKRRMKLGAEDGRKSGVRDRLAVCEWVSERGRGEEGRLRDRKQRLQFLWITSGTLLTETFNFLPATARLVVPWAGFVSRRGCLR